MLFAFLDPLFAVGKPVHSPSPEFGFHSLSYFLEFLLF